MKKNMNSTVEGLGLRAKEENMKTSPKPWALQVRRALTGFGACDVGLNILGFRSLGLRALSL